MKPVNKQSSDQACAGEHLPHKSNPSFKRATCGLNGGLEGCRFGNDLDLTHRSRQVPASPPCTYMRQRTSTHINSDMSSCMYLDTSKSSVSKTSSARMCRLHYSSTYTTPRTTLIDDEAKLHTTGVASSAAPAATSGHVGSEIPLGTRCPSFSLRKNQESHRSWPDNSAVANRERNWPSNSAVAAPSWFWRCRGMLSAHWHPRHLW